MEGHKLAGLDDKTSELTTFTTLSDVYYLCDEGYHYGKRFTGALVGMYAYGGDEDLVATFENPKYVGLRTWTCI